MKTIRMLAVGLFALGMALSSAPARALGPLEWMLLQGAFSWAINRTETSPEAGSILSKAGPTMELTTRWANRLAAKGVLDLGEGASLGLAQALAPGALGFDVKLAKPSSELNTAQLDAEWAPGLKRVVCAPGSFWRTWLMAGGSLTYRVRGADGSLARGYYAQERDCRGR